MIYIPSESEEQIALFEWAEWSEIPELKFMYHVPNGGKRSISEAVRFHREGVKSGVPDICLPVARGKYHGLYVELKRQKGGKVSEEQKKWIEVLNAQGYMAVVAHGMAEAKKIIEQYLREDETNE